MNHPDREKNIVSWWRVILTLLSVILSAGLLEPSRAKSPAGNEARVREFVAAFNARNVDAMLNLADENVQWLSIHEAKVTVETEGKDALRASMVRYFSDCPSCKSTLEWVREAGSRLTAMERASWTAKSGPKSQAGLSIYEFRDGKILRVYYFPADPGSPNR